MFINRLKLTIIILVSLIAMPGVAQFPYQKLTDGSQSDGINLVLNLKGVTSGYPRVSIKTYCDATEFYTPGEDMENFNTIPGKLRIYTKGEEESGSPMALSIDARPYKAYYIDFPVELEVIEDGDYILRTANINRLGITRSIVLIDNKNTLDPVYTNLLAGSYEVNLPKGIYGDRFVVRFYAAEIFKKNTSNNLWDQPVNWFSGVVPSASSHVVIESSDQVNVPSGYDASIGYLSVFGQLINDGKITVTNDTEIVKNN